jgi:hypothetical protein
MRNECENDAKQKQTTQNETMQNRSRRRELKVNDAEQKQTTRTESERCGTEADDAN